LQLLTTLESLHSLLQEMSLEEEAESIEKYADDIQERIAKHDKEEALRLETLQKSLHRNSSSTDWFHHQKKRRPSFSSNHASAAATPKGEQATTPITPGVGGGNETPTTPSLLKKTDSFKQRLPPDPVRGLSSLPASPRTALRYSKQQQNSPSRGRSLRSIEAGVMKSTSNDSATGEGWDDSFEGIRVEDISEPPVEVRKSILLNSQKNHNKDNTITGGTNSLNRVFLDGVLFSSLEDEDITKGMNGRSVLGNGHHPTGMPKKKSRSTHSDGDQENIMETGSAKITTNGNSNNTNFFAPPLVRRPSTERKRNLNKLPEESNNNNNNSEVPVAGNCIVQ
jgi:hypothetical protein